ncbi:MAG: phosphatase PAP2 family protein [Deinococcales bacterium]
MNIIHLLQSLASPWLDKLALNITNLGSEQAYIALLVILYLGINSVIGQRIGVIFLLGFFLNFHLKGMIATERPFIAEPSVLRSAEAGETALGMAFPSGHAQASMTFWGLIAAYFRKPWLYVICALLILLISLSRLYLGVHYPIDVIGGLLIGLGVIFLGMFLDRLLIQQQLGPLSVILAGLILPLALHYILPVESSEMLMGALAAFIIGPSLVKHHNDNTHIGLGARVFCVVLGLALVFGVLVGSSLLLPEALKRHHLIGFIRYLVIGLMATLVTPYLARLFRIMPNYN